MKYLLILVLALCFGCGGDLAGSTESGVEAVDVDQSASAIQIPGPDFHVFVNGAPTSVTMKLCCKENGRSCGCGGNHPECCSACDCGQSPPNSVMLHLQTQGP